MIYDFLISATSKVRPIFDSQKCDLVPLLRSRRTEVYSNNNNNNNNNDNNNNNNNSYNIKIDNKVHS